MAGHEPPFHNPLSFGKQASEVWLLCSGEMYNLVFYGIGNRHDTYFFLLVTRGKRMEKKVILFFFFLNPVPQ